MHLKHLVLNGYKTFANKTSFDFTEGVTAVIGPNGSGKCVVGDSLVTLADGQDIKIRQLVEDALASSTTIDILDDGALTNDNPHNVVVLSLNLETLRLEPRPVTSFVRRKTPDFLTHIRTRSGREVTATAYHPLFTLENGFLRALRADELKTGTRIALPRTLPVQGTSIHFPVHDVIADIKCEDRIYVPYSEQLRAWADQERVQYGTWAAWVRDANVPHAQFIGLLNRQAINTEVLHKLTGTAGSTPPVDAVFKSSNSSIVTRMPAVLDQDLARFMGLLIAEGRSTNANQIWFVNSDPLINNEYERLATRLFGVHVSRNNYKPTSAQDLLIYSYPLQVLLERLFGFKRNSLSAIKAAPPQIFRAEPSIIWAFLSGLFEGDAYICAKPAIENRRAQSYIEYVSASEELARGVVALLLRVGIHSLLRVQEKAACNTVEKTKRPYYAVFIYGSEQLHRMAEYLSFVGAKRDALEVLRNSPHTSNPNLDLVPGATQLVKEAARLAGVSMKRGRRTHVKLCAYYEQRCEASRGGLREVISQIGQLGRTPQSALVQLSRLSVLADSDVYWDEIVSIEQVPPQDEWVYDLCVADTHNFIAGNIIVHNSNVADSIRWALGEQQFSLLRGKKTDDMIFAGSSRRSRASMAEVLLTFDNSDGFFPVEFTEIAIGRRAYRDGANEYLLNGNRVRLRDIIDLLGHTGLAERTYTVIGQGLVDAALTQRPEERRALFEEAAGIGAYRDRRDDALRKLEETRHNLERVRDILAEITPRVSQLERQATRARQYQVLSAELKEHTRNWFGYHYNTARVAVVKATGVRNEYERQVAAARAIVEDLEGAAAQLQRQQTDLRTRLSEAQPHHDEARRKNEAVTRDLAVLRERAASVQSQLAAAQRELHERAGALEGLTIRAAHSAAALIGAQAALARRQLEQQAAEASATERQAVRAQAEKTRTAAQQDLLRANGTLSGVQNRMNAMRARQTVLSKQTRELAERVGRADEQRIREMGMLNELNATIETDAIRGRELALQHETLARELETARTVLSSAQSSLAAAEAEEKMATRVNLFAEMRQQQNNGDLADQAIAARLPGMRGTLASLVQVRPDDRRAVEAALGDLLKAVIMESPEGAARTRVWLIQQKARNTRLSIVPLPLMRPMIEERHRLDAALVERARASHARPLAEALNAPEWLKPALQALAGRMFITRDLDSGRELAAQLPDDALCVTRDGEVVYATGVQSLPPGPRSPIIIGEDSKAETLPLVDPVAAKANREKATAIREKAQHEMDMARRRHDDATRTRDAFARDAGTRRSRRDDAARRITSLEEQQAQMAGDIESAEQELAQVTEQISTASAGLAQYEQAHTQAAHRLTDVETELRELMAGGWLETLNNARAALTIATEAVRNAQNQRRERLSQLADGIAQRDARARRTAEMDAQNAQSQSALQHAEKTATDAADALRELDAFIAPIQVELGNVEQKYTQVEARRRDAERTLRETESRLNATLLELARNDDELKALYERAGDSLDVEGQEQRKATEDTTPNIDAPPEDVQQKAAERQAAVVTVLANLPTVDSLTPGMDERMTQLRNQIKRLGAINFEAQIEYDDLKRRLDFLTTQTLDLERASGSLQQVIVELNDVMQATFRQTFEAIATAFQSTFKILFGGGQARLTLTNADNIDEAGIDIHAQPPGKRPQALALLSGGERSLTAGALLFAILRVKPTPFCVLDEMDAALDEANVARFRSMLETLSEQTQFIVITHNRRTVEAANTIYGISMGADGASTALSLRLDELEMKQQ